MVMKSKCMYLHLDLIKSLNLVGNCGRSPPETIILMIGTRPAALVRHFVNYYDAPGTN